jgi:hypothetical protein
MGRIYEAMSQLAEAFEYDLDLRTQALDEPDLQPLWSLIASLDEG